MGLFSNTRLDPAGPALAPLTKDRIKKALEANRWTYRVDSEGDIAGAWDDGVFWFFTYGDAGEILQVRGVWDGRLSTVEQPRALEAANDWSRDRLFPKVYVRVEDDGVVRLMCEHTVDYEHGLTDEQLDLHIRTAIATGGQFFEQLNEVFPEAAASARRE